MKGFRIVVGRGSSYPFVWAGWVEQHGDEVLLLNSRIIRRFGRNQALSSLAHNGPAKDTQLLELSPVEELHRTLIDRCIVGTSTAWVKECPPPKGFEKVRELWLVALDEARSS